MKIYDAIKIYIYIYIAVSLLLPSSNFIHKHIISISIHDILKYIYVNLK